MWCQVADDYGWIDVGYHGSEIRTPAIDALAYTGIRLDNYYTLPMCTPTRSAIMSGRFPINTGLQVSTISPAKPYGMPLSITTLAEQLQRVGYETHGFGKWHLGYCRPEYTPTYRGFSSYYGYWNGAEHYFTHVRDPDRCPANFSAGLDYRRDMELVKDANGTYSAIDLAQQVTRVLKTYTASGREFLGQPSDSESRIYPDNSSTPSGSPEGVSNSPLFIYLPFQSVHSPTALPPHTCIAPYEQLPRCIASWTYQLA